MSINTYTQAEFNTLRSKNNVEKRKVNSKKNKWLKAGTKTIALNA